MAKDKDGKPKPKEAGATFLQDVLAKLPEDKRDAVKEALESDDVLDLLGQGVLRQSDYSRNLDGLRDSEKRLDDLTKAAWQMYNDNARWKAAEEAKVMKVLEENQRLRKLAGDPDRLLGSRRDDLDPDDDPSGNGSPRLDLSKYMGKDEVSALLAKQREELESQGIGLMTLLTGLSTKHLKDFGEVLDATELVKHATEKGLPLATAYTDFISDKVDEKRQKDHDEALAKAREEGRREVLQQNPALPHPTGNPEPTVLDALTAEDRKAQFGLKAALTQYQEMQRAND